MASGMDRIGGGHSNAGREVHDDDEDHERPRRCGWLAARGLVVGRLKAGGTVIRDTAPARFRVCEILNRFRTC
jgi:hypothetical protein